MVAAWISADTGVGPSMASSSQVCSGNCADFPQAASRSSSPIAVITPCEAPEVSSETWSNEVVPKVTKIRPMPSDRPMSPTRLITKAFLAAAAAEGLYCQNPISRYDARPTPSQPRKMPT